MAMSAWPFADTDTTEAQFGILFHQLQDDGLLGVPGESSGAVTPVAGLTVRAAPFDFAFLGGVAVTSSTTVDVTLDAASASTRIDRIIIRIDAGDNVSLAILKGTPGLSTAAPLTQVPGGVYELALARVTLPAGATVITSANISDERAWTAGRVGRWTTATRPGMPGQRSPIRGDFGFNVSVNMWEGWNGTTWVPFTLVPETPPDVVSTTGFVAASGWTISRARFLKIGRLVSFDLALTRTGSPVTANSVGVVPGLQVGTVTDERFRPGNLWGPGSSDMQTALRSMGILGNATTIPVYLIAILPGQEVATGATISSHFNYLSAT